MLDSWFSLTDDGSAVPTAAGTLAEPCSRQAAPAAASREEALPAAAPRHAASCWSHPMTFNEETICLLHKLITFWNNVRIFVLEITNKQCQQGVSQLLKTSDISKNI